MDFAAPLDFFFSDFWNPGKRIFAGYLALSVLLAFAWLVFVKRQSIRTAFSKIFDSKVFFSNSAKADYKIFMINRAVTFLISPLLLSQVAISTAIFFWLHGIDFFQRGSLNHWPVGVIVGIFTLTMFVIDDLTKYLVHRWMHKWPSLWAIHKVHHSATTLTPVTVYRVHPLEGVLYALRSTVAQGTVIPITLFFFGNAVDLYTIVGVNVLVFTFHVTGSNLRHSHININYWPWLEHLLISPAQHQVHHSIAEEHYDKNFGAALAIWDWTFGSLHLSETDKHLEFGLDATQSKSDASLKQMYVTPLKEIFQSQTKRFRQLIGKLY